MPEGLYAASIAAELTGSQLDEWGQDDPFARFNRRRAAGADMAANGRLAPARPRVSVVIPTHNEAKNLAHVLPRLPAEVDELIIVDGHSEDGTPAVAQRLHPGARLVMQNRRGKGNALACGFRAARGDIIVTLDARWLDGPRGDPEVRRRPPVGRRLREGLAIHGGRRQQRLERVSQPGQPRARPCLVNLLFRTRYTDLCYGYNAFWTECSPVVYRECDGFEVETVLNVRAARAGLDVVEVPSFEHERIHGTSNLRAFPDGLRVLRTIISERVRPGGPKLAVAGRRAS